MSNTHDARGEWAGYKWKRANIFPRGPSYLFPAMAERLSLGTGSFSPTTDGYDRRIEPVASLPRWLSMQQRDEYPRRNQTIVATPRAPPPERERRYAV